CVLKKNGKVKSSIVGKAAKCKKGNVCGAALGFFSTFDACDPDGTCAGPTTTTTTSPPPITSTTSTTTTPTTLLPPCPLRESPGLPSQITLTVPATGSDLDNGWTGTSHNFPIINGTTLRYCLSGCDGKTTFDCTGTGATGAGSINGATFGAPLPLL